MEQLLERCQNPDDAERYDLALSLASGQDLRPPRLFEEEPPSVADDRYYFLVMPGHPREGNRRPSPVHPRACNRRPFFAPRDSGEVEQFLALLGQKRAVAITSIRFPPSLEDGVYDPAAEPIHHFLRGIQRQGNLVSLVVDLDNVFAGLVNLIHFSNRLKSLTLEKHRTGAAGNLQSLAETVQRHPSLDSVLRNSPRFGDEAMDELEALAQALARAPNLSKMELLTSAIAPARRSRILPRFHVLNPIFIRESPILSFRLRNLRLEPADCRFLGSAFAASTNLQSLTLGSLVFRDPEEGYRMVFAGIKQASSLVELHLATELLSLGTAKDLFHLLVGKTDMHTFSLIRSNWPSFDPNEKVLDYGAYAVAAWLELNPSNLRNLAFSSSHMEACGLLELNDDDQDGIDRTLGYSELGASDSVAAELVVALQANEHLVSLDLDRSRLSVGRLYDIAHCFMGRDCRLRKLNMANLILRQGKATA